MYLSNKIPQICMCPSVVFTGIIYSIEPAKGTIGSHPAQMSMTQKQPVNTDKGHGQVSHGGYTDAERSMVPELIRLSQTCAARWKMLASSRKAVSRNYASILMHDRQAYTSIVNKYKEAKQNTPDFSDDIYMINAGNIVRHDLDSLMVGVKVLKKDFVLVQPFAMRQSECEGVSNLIYRTYETDKFSDTVKVREGFNSIVQECTMRFKRQNKHPEITQVLDRLQNALKNEGNGFKVSMVYPPNPTRLQIDIHEGSNPLFTLGVFPTKFGNFDKTANWIRETVQSCGEFEADFGVELMITEYDGSTTEEMCKRAFSINLQPNIAEPIMEEPSVNNHTQLQRKYLFVESSSTLCTGVPTQDNSSNSSNPDPPKQMYRHRQTTAVHIKTENQKLEHRTPYNTSVQLQNATEHDFMQRIFQIQFGVLKLFVRKYHADEKDDLRDIQISPDAKSCRFRMYHEPTLQQTFITLSSMYSIHVDAQNNGNDVATKILVNTSYTIRDTFKWRHPSNLLMGNFLVSKSNLDEAKKQRDAKGYYMFSKMPSSMQLGAKMVSYADQQEHSPLIEQTKGSCEQHLNKRKPVLKVKVDGSGNSGERRVVKHYDTRMSTGTVMHKNNNNNNNNMGGFHSHQMVMMTPPHPPPHHPVMMLQQMPLPPPPPPLQQRMMFAPQPMAMMMARPPPPSLIVAHSPSGMVRTGVMPPSYSYSQRNNKESVANLKKDVRWLREKVNGMIVKRRLEKNQDMLLNQSHDLAKRIARSPLPYGRNVMDLSQIRTNSEKGADNEAMHLKAIDFWKHKLEPTMRKMQDSHVIQAPAGWTIHDYKKLLLDRVKDEAQENVIATSRGDDSLQETTHAVAKAQKKLPSIPEQKMVGHVFESEEDSLEHTVVSSSPVVGNTETTSAPAAIDDNAVTSAAEGQKTTTKEDSREQKENHWASTVWPGGRGVSEEVSSSPVLLAAHLVKKVASSPPPPVARNSCLSLEESRRVLSSANLLGMHRCSQVLQAAVSTS